MTLYFIRHAWLGYLTEASPENTTFLKAEAKTFTLSEASEYLDAPERDFSRQYYKLEVSK